MSLGHRQNFHLLGQKGAKYYAGATPRKMYPAFLGDRRAFLCSLCHTFYENEVITLIVVVFLCAMPRRGRLSLFSTPSFQCFVGTSTSIFPCPLFHFPPHQFSCALPDNEQTQPMMPWGSHPKFHVCRKRAGGACVSIFDDCETEIWWRRPIFE